MPRKSETLTNNNHLWKICKKESIQEMGLSAFEFRPWWHSKMSYQKGHLLSKKCQNLAREGIRMAWDLEVYWKGRPQQRPEVSQVTYIFKGYGQNLDPWVIPNLWWRLIPGNPGMFNQIILKKNNCGLFSANY